MKNKNTFRFGNTKIAFSFVIATLITLNSCNKTETLSPSTKNVSSYIGDKYSITVEKNRMVFKNHAEYSAYLNDIAKNGEGKLLKIEQTLNFNSLRANKNTIGNDEFNNYPVLLIAALNKDQEVIVGKTIYWYNNGKIYHIENTDENLLKQTKSNPTSSTAKGEYNISSLVSPSSKNSKANNVKNIPFANYTISAGTGGWISSPYSTNVSDTFYYLNQGGSRRRWVDQLFVLTITNDDESVNTFLGLNMKCEYLTSNGDWYNAGEARNLSFTTNSIDYSVTGGTVIPGSTYIYNTSGNYTNVTGEQQPWLVGTQLYFGSPTWSGSVSLNIGHHINGDTNPTWYDYTSW